MLVEETAGNQVALHLPKFFPDLSSLCSTGPTLLKLVFGELPVTKVRRRDPRSSVLGPRPSACSSVESTAAVLLVGWTLTRCAPTCLRTASLTRPVRPKPPLNTDGHVVFCQHEYHPAYEVLLYRKLSGASRGLELAYRGRSRGPQAAKLGALAAARVSFGKASKCE